MEDADPLPFPYEEDRIMANLKDSLLSRLVKSNPSLSINKDHAFSFIQQRLPKLFPSFHTPTHPPYALMIQNALTGLNERSGSTEKEISAFIEREYKDLPVAHVRILRVQLKKLCEIGELVCNEGGRYVLVVDGVGGLVDDDSKEIQTQCKDSKKRKCGKDRNNHGNRESKERVERCEGVESDNELQEEGIKEQILVSELQCARTDEPSRMVECSPEQVEEEWDPLIEKIEDQEQAEKGLFEVVGKQSQLECQRSGVRAQHAEAEVSAQSEVEKSQISQIQDPILHFDTISSSQQTALNLPVEYQQPLLVPISEGLPKCLLSSGIELSLTQLQQQMPCHGPSESSLDAAAKMSASLSSLDVCEHKQDENAVSGDPEQQTPKRQCRGRPPKSKPDADYQRESLLPSCGVIVTAQKPNIDKIEKWWLKPPQERGVGRRRHCKKQGNKIGLRWLSQPQGRRMGWGRHCKLYRNAYQLKEQMQLQDHAQGLASLPYLDQKEKETINSSQATSLNFPVNVTHNFGQPLVVPISEGSPELQLTELQLQISSDNDLGATSKRDGSLAYVNVHDVHLQHCNQDSSKGNLYKNPMTGDPEQRPPKRPRGRPPKVKTVASHPGDLLLSSDDGILKKQNPNINNMEKQYQYGQGRGRGRPHKLNRNVNQPEKLLQPDDQAQQHCQRRGRGRPPKLHRSTNQCEEQLQLQDQAQALLLPLQVRSSGGAEAGTNVNQSQWQQLQWRTSQTSRLWQTCLESGINSLSDANQSLKQLWPQLFEVEGHQQDQGWEQNHDLVQERPPPKPMLYASQSHQLMQRQACEDQGRRCPSRPPKQN